MNLVQDAIWQDLSFTWSHHGQLAVRLDCQEAVEAAALGRHCRVFFTKRTFELKVGDNLRFSLQTRPPCVSREKSWLDYAECCESLSTQKVRARLWPVYLYVKPVYLCGAAFRRYVITSTACLELCGFSWPLCIVCTWCSLSIVWTYSLSPWCIVCTWCFLSIVWTYSLSPWCIVCAKLCGVLSDSTPVKLSSSRQQGKASACMKQGCPQQQLSLRLWTGLWSTHSQCPQDCMYAPGQCSLQTRTCISEQWSLHGATACMTSVWLTDISCDTLRTCAHHVVHPAQLSQSIHNILNVIHYISYTACYVLYVTQNMPYVAWYI